MYYIGGDILSEININIEEIKVVFSNLFDKKKIVLNTNWGGMSENKEMLRYNDDLISIEIFFFEKREDRYIYFFQSQMNTLIKSEVDSFLLKIIEILKKDNLKIDFDYNLISEDPNLPDGETYFISS